jgi:hypothetical protein
VPWAGFRGDPGAVAGLRYKDRVREKARQKREAVRAATEEARTAEVEERVERRVKNLPWSKAKKLAPPAPAGGAGRGKDCAGHDGGGKKRGRGGESSDSGEEEMMREAALLKKLKQGRITQAQFQAMAGPGWSDDDE